MKTAEKLKKTHFWKLKSLSIDKNSICTKKIWSFAIFSTALTCIKKHPTSPLIYTMKSPKKKLKNTAKSVLVI